MKKEQVYINLKGKTKEELTDLWEFLTSNGEIVSDTKEYFIETHLKYNNSFIALGSDNTWKWWGAYSKTEITITQLKQIIKPMGTFTPIAMKCTQEQFDAVRNKLENFIITNIVSFNNCNYLVNNCGDRKLFISNVTKPMSLDYSREVHEEWDEEIFLKACGIEVETLQEQLQKAQLEVERLQKQIEEENKPKKGDFVKNEYGFIYKLESDIYTTNLKKITNPELIKLLKNE